MTAFNVRKRFVLLLLLTVIGVVTLPLLLSRFTELPEVTEAPAPTPLTATGTLMVTGIDTATSKSAVYEMTLPSGTMQKVRDGYYYGPTRAQNGYVAVLAEDESGDFQLFLNNGVDEEDATVVMPPEPLLYTVGQPAWSHDGRYLVYLAKEHEESDPEYPFDDAHIVLLDTETFDQEVLGTGVSPQFMPNGDILFLQEGGVYKYIRNGMEIESEVGVAAFPDDATSTPSVTIAVSRSGKYLTLTDPERATLFVYQLDEAGTLKEVRAIHAIATAPGFLTNESGLAYITYLKDNDVTKRFLAVLDLTTLESVLVSDLSSFDDYMFSMKVWQ
ncbi:MAG: hypothetical protein RLZZ234_372 [Candidatus Parcubacteria bacterium]|jgi:hypothetical protein